ncbi:MAG: DUF58 domain-containing protein [Deltaproteobacteria bacterium]|nr:DUF58 domain-containing protein [Deltaproteobacteria bacterium]
MNAALRTQAERDANGLRVRAQRDVSTALSGAYRSAYRGQGLTFEELRDYEAGEDAAHIEWNATARLGYPVAVQMREERDLLLALLVDVSPSLGVGFGDATKLDAVRRAAAALAVAAVRASDRVALATFGSGLVHTLRPGTGPAHLERLFRALYERAPAGPTDAAPALAWAADTLPRHSVVVLLSDLLFPDPAVALANCARKHELAVLRVSDPADSLPDRMAMAPVRVAPAEEGHPTLWRGRPTRWRGRATLWNTRRRRSRQLAPLPEGPLRKRGARCGVLQTGPDLIPSLHRFLEQHRGRRFQ